MIRDDSPRGRLLSRREVLLRLSGSAAWLLAGGLLARRSEAGDRVPACLFRPEQTEGPYFVDEELHRSDIRSDPTTGEMQAGVPLALTVVLSRVDDRRCVAVPRAQVHLWHCDAFGIYSDVKDPRFDTRGKKFLRGYQLTDTRGEARFLTIYPGWYHGRTVHIHLKVRAADGKRMVEFTSQMYFEDSLSDRIHAGPPYAARGQRTARNHDDRIFRHGGDQLILEATRTADGYAATFEVGMQFSQA